MKTVRLSFLLGLLLALWLGVDPNLIAVSYPILMEVVSTLDVTQTKKAKKLRYKEED